MLEAVIVGRAGKENANAFDLAAMLTVERFAAIHVEARLQIRERLSGTGVRAAAVGDAIFVPSVGLAATLIATVWTKPAVISEAASQEIMGCGRTFILAAAGVNALLVNALRAVPARFPAVRLIGAEFREACPKPGVSLIRALRFGATGSDAVVIRLLCISGALHTTRDVDRAIVMEASFKEIMRFTPAFFHGGTCGDAIVIHRLGLPPAILQTTGTVSSLDEKSRNRQRTFIYLARFSRSGSALRHRGTPCPHGLLEARRVAGIGRGRGDQG